MNLDEALEEVLANTAASEEAVAICRNYLEYCQCDVDFSDGTAYCQQCHKKAKAQ